MRFGRKCPRGFLPIFSVNTEDEARRLLVLTCPRTDDGQAHFAPELREKQTLRNLYAFGARLRAGYARIRKDPEPAAIPAKRTRARGTRKER